ncbi:[protein-PII] uridylyltransferase [Akkermansiaceae bacterium]|nr:[protein-PII] uridylyltransferase [Akkermansiaceae bacterium]
MRMTYVENMHERAGSLTSPDSSIYKEFMVDEMSQIRKYHDKGVGGLEVASYRSALIDKILAMVFSDSLKKSNISEESNNIGIYAVGGYGRGHLNPYSDIDILFLLPKAARSLSKKQSDCIQAVLYVLWDLGLKIGHATRSVTECITEGKANQQSKTAMMDSRFVCGSNVNEETLHEKFEKQCVEKGIDDFHEVRIYDIKSRHKKYSHTVFLQEPHVKESCGGLRDFQNVLWLGRCKRGFRSIKEFNEGKVLTKIACKEMAAAYDFLHRVRNELHFYAESGTDILTLRLQGVVATNFKYPEKSILRRCESFMRDYYRHTRALYQYSLSLLEVFEIEIEDKEGPVWNSWLTKRRKNREEFDSFISKNGRIYPKNKNVFLEDSHQMMVLFLHCQKRELKLSPIMRQLVKKSIDLVDTDFKKSKANRETFQAILESKGEVSRVLRQMHRVGFLGAYLPEFGAMDCLVQHEFFHRYTADEHTLRCIDELDALTDNRSSEKQVYRQLLRDVEDPYGLYMALILHDSGRAENVREHIDGSAMLASRVCTRLQIRGSRRRLIMFLVDHHLTFWRFATNRNLEDPAVIEEFAGLMKHKSYLSALFLFTYADSNGTNEEAWSPWKEMLMIQLYKNTMSFMSDGKETYDLELRNQQEELKKKTKSVLKEKYYEQLDHHFERMPCRYFQVRNPNDVAVHVRAARRFLKNIEGGKEGYNSDLRWIDRENRGYSDLIITCWNRALLLEKACCALASNDINIISADVFTRTDNVVCDILRVSTLDWESVKSESKKKRVVDTFNQLCLVQEYDPKNYLKKKKNIFKKEAEEEGIPFPVRAVVMNELSEDYTAIQIQALDRIGLLHDLFLEINLLGLATVHARICTEKGAALNTIYVSYPEGGKITEPDEIIRIEDQIGKLLHKEV